MFNITLLPAREGDCLWVEYGSEALPHRFLIDGGRKGTYQELRNRALSLPEDQREFELLVVTHIDRDHIEGILALMEDADAPLSFKDIWFNGYEHLFQANKIENLGAEMGEALSAWLKEPGMHWNRAFSQGPVFVPNDGALPRIELSEGMLLILLSPSASKLNQLITAWEKECKQAGIMPGDGYEIVAPTPTNLEAYGAIDVDALADSKFDGDSAAANGSSIAFVAEYQGKRVLFGADVHADLLETSVARLSPDSPLELDLFKLSHHGSENNVSRPLLERLSCARYAISTNGSYFKHPSPSAIARVIKYGKAKYLHFNYRSDYTRKWGADYLTQAHGFAAHYPVNKNDGTVLIEL